MIGLREDQHMKARMINFLNHATIAECGSWLACDSGGSETELLSDTSLSRASPLPQGRAVGVRPAAASAASKAAG